MKNKKSWRYGIGGAAAFLVLWGVIALLPDIRRYMRIRSM